jgi:hypothetical protein
MQIKKDQESQTFNIQKQKPSTSKSKSKNLQHPRIKVRTFNIQE